MKDDQDTAQRFLLEAGDIRGELVHLNDTFTTILRQHDYPDFVRRLFGEVLVATVLLTSTLKFEGELTMQLDRESGPIRFLVVKCTNDYQVRGFVEWEGGEEAFQAAFESGHLVITVRMKDGAHYYQSMVPLAGGSVSSAIEHYFDQSEQIATRLWISVSDTQASGLLLQCLPVQDVAHTREDQQVQWAHLLALTDTISPEELLTLSNAALLGRLYAFEEVRIFDQQAIAFACTCTRERMARAVVVLGEKEAQELLDKQSCVEVTCQYCSNQHVFDAIDVAQIFLAEPDQTRH